MISRCGWGLIRVLLAAVSAIGLGLITTSYAVAVEPVHTVEVRLDSMKPALPTRGGTITMTGRVRNITDQPIEQPRVYFWRNQAPITSREGLDQALGSESNDPIGRRLANDTLVELTREGAPALAPGKSASFSITVKVNDLELSPTDGVYLMGIQVLIRTNNIAIGRGRVFVPVVATEPDRPLKMTTIAVLNSRPSLIADKTFADDHLAGEVSEGGRLTTLLEAAAGGAQISFAVDPALIEELEVMAKGYRLRNVDGGEVNGTGAEDAERWLADFATLKTDHDGYRMLYGSPDVTALTRDGQREPIRDSLAAGERVIATRGLPLLVVPPDGMVDKAAMDTISTLDPKAVLLSDRSARGNGPLLTGYGSADPAPIVRYSESASGGGPGPDPRSTATQIRQRGLAETWIQATNRTDDTAQGQVRVITTAAQAGDDPRAVQAPWLKPSTLSELLATSPLTWEPNFRFPASARKAELSQGQLAGLKRFRDSSQANADVLADPDPVRQSAQTAVARAASSMWRRHDVERQFWLTPQRARLEDRLLNKLVISSSPRVSTTAQDDVTFPITVKNDLASTGPNDQRNAVSLRLVFTSENPARLSIKSVDIPLLPPQDSTQEVAAVTAKANGTVPVRAQLETRSGLKVGRPVTIDVKVTQNGTTGWAIAIAAGVVLAGSTALRIRQVARERAASGGSDDSGAGDDSASGVASTSTDDLLSSAPPVTDDVAVSLPVKDHASSSPVSDDTLPITRPEGHDV